MGGAPILAGVYRIMLNGIFVLIIPAAACCAADDAVSVGIKAGVPLTDVFPKEGFFGRRPFIAEMRRFTLGPVLEVGLPGGFAFEFDALYKRFEQSGEFVLGQTATERVSSWEFPLLGKYRAGRSIVRPYVEAGVSLNRLSGFLLPFRGTPSSPPTGTETRTGLVAGGGLDIRIPVVRLTTGIRYSRWGERLFVPGTDLVDFQIGVLF